MHRTRPRKGRLDAAIQLLQAQGCKTGMTLIFLLSCNRIRLFPKRQV